VDQSGVEKELKFTDVVRFFRRNWRLVVGFAALAGTGTALVLFLIVPRKYEASATLVIVPPRFSSDLKPQTLTVQSYQKILESDAVVGETKKRVVRQSFWSADKPLRLGRELQSRIFVSRRAEETTLAPMLQAVTRGRTGEQAAAIANAWAEVFLERTRELAVGSTSSTVQFIDQEYPKVRDALAKLEDARVAEAKALQERYDRTATAWDDRITTLKNATTQLVANHEAETRRLVESFNSEKSLDSRGARLEALRKAYSDLQDEQARVASQLQLKQLQLEAARKQLAETTPLVTLQKAMTDEAVWRSVADSKGASPDWTALQQRSLATQEVNPVYTSLSEKVAEIEMDVNAMVPRATGLTKDLDRINEEMKLLEAGLRDDQASLEKLQGGRYAELAQLKEQRANDLVRLNRGRRSELESLQREMDTRLAQLDRDILQQSQLFDQLAKNYNQAILAKGQQDVEDVRLGAMAVPPETPLARRAASKSLLGSFLGFLFGVGVALVRESWG
jgi:uncharacterized protein involved in exopolysaccharide biosynthesis